MKENNTPHAQMLDPNTTALVVVDLQAKLMPAVEDAEQVLRNTQLLLRLAQVLELPTILTSQYPKVLGRIVPEITECAAGVEPIEDTLQAIDSVTLNGRPRSRLPRNHQ